MAITTTKNDNRIDEDDDVMVYVNDEMVFFLKIQKKIMSGNWPLICHCVC